ncbi:MAG: DUF2807 domain-containing protein [Cyclobacteriaceae bacterium]|nr:DUF2807 domain-containing protein [Cyclobacteriaceae bacterium]
MNIFKTIGLAILYLTLANNAVIAQKSEERNVGNFDEVKVSQAINCFLKEGNTEKIRVEVEGIDLDDVITEVSGGRLLIHLDRGNFRNVHVKVYVTYKSLEGISVSSAADVYSESVIKSETLDLSASSAGSMDLDIDVNELSISASSAADIELEGKANYLEAGASSAAEVDAYDVLSKKVRADASSGASIKVNATEEIMAEASSGASIRYKGNPSKSNTDSSSGGSVRKF